MARMPRTARTARMPRWLADYPDPILTVRLEHPAKKGVYVGQLRPIFSELGFEPFAACKPQIPGGKTALLTA